jgi:hypothetical protein
MVGVWLVNTVLNAVVPPDDAVPETTRRALLSCVVDFVNPVGAAVWTNSITVPDGIACGADPLDAAVIKPFALTVMLEKVNEPTFELTVASVVALPDEVTSPVKLAFVVTVDALPVKEAVIVPALKFPDASRATIALAVFADVAVVAELLTFDAVEIVASLVSTIPAEALMSSLTITPEAIDVAFPTEVTSPVKLALVVTLLAVNAVAVPVIFVPTKADGVPNAGVTSVGLSDSTLDPVPVEDVTPVPPLATGKVPLT